MLRGILFGSTLLALVTAHARAADYIGLCEASAGAFLDNKYFAAASDESNTLQIYERGKPDPIGAGVDLEKFTSFDKSDLEGAAAVGDRVYWISSHSFNSSGEDKRKRKVFFATRIALVDRKPTLVGVGRPAVSLRDNIAKAAGVAPRDMNIEALAATPEGALLIGLRAPLREGKALIVPFKNPAAVVDSAAPPEFGEALPINLQGFGLRSMDLVESGDTRYVIVAGPVSDSSEEFAIFRWSGPGADPVKIEGLNLAGIKPEAAMAVPGQGLVQLLSDDGHICSDEDDPPNKRKFRSIDIKP